MNWEVETGRGPVPVVADDELCPNVVILAHGAGGSMESMNLLWLAGIVKKSLDAQVVRFNFLYRGQGRSMPDRMPVLIEAYRAVIESVRERLAPKRLIIGGHSMGGRVASMLEAEGKTADGLLLFSYPLHPPGQTEKLRDAHLPSIQTPTLQFNGTRDEFCDFEIMSGIASRLDPAFWRLIWLEGADHALGVKRSSERNRADTEDAILATCRHWLETLALGR